MSRVINTNSPTKIRNQHRRLIAELMQRLGKKQQIDDEVKDMSAAIVFSLRAIFETCETAAKAWEKRDYWIKAERFLRDWRWTQRLASNIEDVIREGAWDLIPQLLMELFPHFSDIQVKTLTKKPIEWQGAYKRLMAQPPDVLPY